MNTTHRKAAATPLQETAESFRATIFLQQNLIELAKKLVDAEDPDLAEALLISIGRFNDDLFTLYEQLHVLTGPEDQAPSDKSGQPQK